MLPDGEARFFGPVRSTLSVEPLRDNWARLVETLFLRTVGAGFFSFQILPRGDSNDSRRTEIVDFNCFLRHYFQHATVGIPSLIFHRYFERLVDEYVVDMEAEALKLIDILHGDREAS